LTINGPFPITSLGNIASAATTMHNIWIVQTDITTVGLPALTTLTGYVELVNNASLTSLGLGALTQARSVWMQNNTALRECLVDAMVAQLSPPPLGVTAMGNDGLPNTCP
jgi:hypothetical protein